MKRRKAVKNLKPRQSAFDALRNPQGYKRPGSLSGRK
jgi:hypothetical protein